MAGAVERRHGTTIALGTAAALIRGPAGAGKSDLALRCLTTAPTALIPVPAQLVADDQTEITLCDAGLAVNAPDTIHGKLEVRGLGILNVPVVALATLRLIVELVASERIERHPDPTPKAQIMGVDLPVLHVAPFEASAPIKVLLALARLMQKNDRG